MRTALIVGSAGQDGTILTSQLESESWEVVGVGRTTTTRTTERLPDVGAIRLEHRAELESAIRVIQPDWVFFLAAFHHSSEEAQDADTPRMLRTSLDVHVDGFASVLESLARYRPSARTFYAASSHVFGAPTSDVQDEMTAFAPTSIYGITKAAGVELARFYRRRGMHVSTGILYNHESPIRAEKFVSQRIVAGAVEAMAASARGEPYALELGSLSTVVDWGWAPDYTLAMQRIVASSTPDDYVVATGIPHSIADFCRIAFDAVGLDYIDFVRESSGRLTRQLSTLVGNPSRLKRCTGWEPTVTFAEMVRHLVNARLKAS